VAQLLGLNVSIFSIKSQASILALGKRFFIGYLDHLGKDLINSKAFSFVI
jgi:hypothetical protein